ncbi:ParB-like nuclease domain-containing protein [Myxococcus stipitatus DSM 14675]|uniref:ParB-like nuclease domain-containing protein n=1 Tax=Myxococcus stipitatus (strain DSM 14675 / JCM 12634 / Mx s8) TaxID=1278073 RepID=L7UBU9_MYXSD|nr:ParB/RepB/Spo0J family partition protein [Myxococcus stipitatus]AGC46371.1 ParB-like nuclease domain-containing protein [Myxococcus stipitatus DSM 14675]
MPGSPEGGSSSAPEAISARGDGGSEVAAQGEPSFAAPARVDGGEGEPSSSPVTSADASSVSPEGGSVESHGVAAEGAPGAGEPERAMESSVGSSEESQVKSPTESGDSSGEPKPEARTEEAPASEARAEVPSPQAEASPEATSSEAGSRSDADASGADASDAEEEPGLELLAAPEQRLAGRVVTVLLPLERLEDDVGHRLRPEGDVSGLATDIARLGQLFPVDVRPRGGERYQLVCGFRRVAALRFLKRDAVQARVHTDLSDEDALLMSLAEAIHATPVDPEVLEAKREQLESQGRLSAAVADMLAKALATEDSLAPEGVEEEIDADELAGDVSQRLGAINQDLSLLADVFASLDESRRAELLMQLRYSSELVAYLEGL